MSIAEAEPFHAVLFPHRSLTRRGYLVLMAVVAGAMGFAALRTWAIGAWPVSLFAVADILLVWGAFKLSYRSGRQFEEITVTPSEVLIRKVSPAGRVREHRFQTAWARLAVVRRDEDVVNLEIGSHGRAVVIGAFLNPEDRASFASALSDAISRSRGRG